MAKSKAKQVFSLKNFVIMFIAIGALVAMSFWVGRQSRPTQAASCSSWVSTVSTYAGRQPSYCYANGAAYCEKTVYGARFVVYVTSGQSGQYLVQKFWASNLLASKYVNSASTAGWTVRSYCN